MLLTLYYTSIYHNMHVYVFHISFILHHLQFNFIFWFIPLFCVCFLSVDLWAPPQASMGFPLLTLQHQLLFFWHVPHDIVLKDQRPWGEDTEMHYGTELFDFFFQVGGVIFKAPPLVKPFYLLERAHVVLVLTSVQLSSSQVKVRDVRVSLASVQ